MKKLLAVVSLAALLSCGVECFKISEKDYENIDRILEFGAQIFFNYLDKIKEVTERMVRDNQLKTNRIAIQNSWNSFKETANKFSVEERGKGVQDDLLLVARTIRRLVMYYQDDIHNMVYSLAAENGIQHHLPAVDMFKGIIEKEKLNEIWRDMESYYFPDAPSVNTDLLQYLCYLLSTNTMKTVIVDILKIGADMTSQIRRIDFQVIKDRLQSVWKEIHKKATEFEALEREKWNDDDFLLAVRVVVRLWLFYFDKLLEHTESPQFMEEVKQAERKLKDEKFSKEWDEMMIMLRPLKDSQIITEALGLHFDFFEDIYIVIIFSPFVFVKMMGKKRTSKIERALHGIFQCAAVSILEKLHEMDMFSVVKRLHSGASDIANAIAEVEEFKTFRRIVLMYWTNFIEEANRVLGEEKTNRNIFQLAQIRAMVKLFSNYSNQLLSKINGNVNDDEAEHILKNIKKMRDIYMEKLLTRGIVTQEELEESQRVLAEGFFDFLDFFGLKEDFFWDLYKVTLVFFNSLYASLIDTWNYISV